MDFHEKVSPIHTSFALFFLFLSRFHYSWLNVVPSLFAQYLTTCSEVPAEVFHRPGKSGIHSFPSVMFIQSPVVFVMIYKMCKKALKKILIYPFMFCKLCFSMSQELI